MEQFKKHIPHAKDWEFIQRTLQGIPPRLHPALFCAYLASWRHAAINEPKTYRKDNAGRRAANTRIRESALGIKTGNASVLSIYSRLLESGPKVSCATCSKCSLEGVCTAGGEAVKPCSEWKADFTK